MTLSDSNHESSLIGGLDHPAKGDRGWCRICGGVLIWTIDNEQMRAHWSHMLQFNYGWGPGNNHDGVLGDLMHDMPSEANALQITLVYSDQMPGRDLPAGTVGAGRGVPQLEFHKHRMNVQPSWATLMTLKWAQLIACEEDAPESIRACLLELMGAAYAWVRAMEERGDFGVKVQGNAEIAGGHVNERAHWQSFLADDGHRADTSGDDQRGGNMDRSHPS